MNMGDRVFYRISGEDARKRNNHLLGYQKLRDMVVRHDQKTPEHLGAGRLMEMLATALIAPEGKFIIIGELLPADVVRCYSAEEAQGYFGRDMPEHPKPSADFSGKADLRVLLPGNDVLFVPEALEDVSPKSASGWGHGTTSLPEHGKFTTAAPASLLG